MNEGWLLYPGPENASRRFKADIKEAKLQNQQGLERDPNMISSKELWRAIPNITGDTTLEHHRVCVRPCCQMGSHVLCLLWFLQQNVSGEVEFISGGPAADSIRRTGLSVDMRKAAVDTRRASHLLVLILPSSTHVHSGVFSPAARRPPSSSDLSRRNDDHAIITWGPCAQILSVVLLCSWWQVSRDPGAAFRFFILQSVLCRIVTIKSLLIICYWLIFSHKTMKEAMKQMLLMGRMPHFSARGDALAGKLFHLTNHVIADILVADSWGQSQLSSCTSTVCSCTNPWFIGFNLMFDSSCAGLICLLCLILNPISVFPKTFVASALTTSVRLHSGPV